jgi:Ca2+:H+ antiporter
MTKASSIGARLRSLLRPSLQWLLVFIPVALWAEHAHPQAQVLIFASACLAIIPLAGLLGLATEHLATRAGEGIGGFLNATFGNLAELIIAVVALRAGHAEVVKASLTGSIIGNVLLVLGAAFFVGGLKRPVQHFKAAGALAQASTLSLAAFAFIIPAGFHALVGGAMTAPQEHRLSLGIALVLLAVYLCGLVFSLRTHRALFSASGGEEALEHTPGGAHWSTGRSVGVLLGVSALIAWMSEVLVGSVEGAAHALGMSQVFVGVIVVAIVGNAAEHSTAILMALKNRMDLAVGIAIGSSTQIALFVAPFLVLASYVLAPQPMDLTFTLPEVLAVVLSALLISQAVSNGETNWFEGLQLLGLYGVLGVAFYFLP